MLSQAESIFRKIRGCAGRDSRENDVTDTPSPCPSPRAIHISDAKRSPTRPPRRPGVEMQFLNIIVVKATGAPDFKKLYTETPTQITFATATSIMSLLNRLARYQIQWAAPSCKHACLVYTYDASSKESWDEVIALDNSMRSRCKDGVRPFLATVFAGMDKGKTEVDGEATVSHAEAEEFVTQQDCRSLRFSPYTGDGVCEAIGSLVELAHGTRDQYTLDQKGYPQRLKRARAMEGLFPS
ncbi:hypothetical protein BJY04DRAFT_213967 [Aspergillus karnatakaensis]|uniref:uncharacterized protein n=1 Tax=Aspergillus karnatakaensis TaxID=1810916 RepID=UPI003CCD65C7